MFIYLLISYTLLPRWKSLTFRARVMASFEQLAKYRDNKQVRFVRNQNYQPDYADETGAEECYLKPPATDDKENNDPFAKDPFGRF